MALTLESIMAQLQGIGGGPSAPPIIPGTSNTGNTIVMPESSTAIGPNIGTGQMAFQGLSSLAGILGGMQTQKLAKESFKLNKQMSNANLNNQIKTYNTALGDRTRSRGFTEGQSAEQMQGYLDANRLTR